MLVESSPCDELKGKDTYKCHLVVENALESHKALSLNM